MAAGLTRGEVTAMTAQDFFNGKIAPLLLAAGWRFVEQVMATNTSGASGMSSVWVSPTTLQSGGGGGFGGSGYIGANDIVDVPVQTDGVTAETDLLTDGGLWDFDSSNGFYYEGIVLIFEFNSTTVLRVKVAEQYADSGTPTGPRCKRVVNGTDSSVAVTSTAMFTQSEAWVGLGDSTTFGYVGFGSFNLTVQWGAEVRSDLFIMTTRIANQNYFCVAGKLPQNPTTAALYDNSKAVFLGNNNDGLQSWTIASTTRMGTFRSSRAPFYPVSGPANPFAFCVEMAFPTRTQITTNWVDTTYALYGYHRSSGNTSPKHVIPPNHSLPLVGQAWLWAASGPLPSGRSPQANYLPDFLVFQIETQAAAGGISEIRIVTPRRPLTRFHEDEMLPAAVGDTAVGLPPVADDEAMTQMTAFTKYYVLGQLDAGTGAALAGAGSLMLAVKGQ